MDDLILRNLRYLMAAQDVLIHLGDVIFYEYPKLKAMLDSVPGTKMLVMGNHDRKAKGWYMRNGFAFAADMIVIDDVLLSHKPQPLPPWIRLNVHGHWHNATHRREESESFYDPKRHKLLAVEFTNYKPVRFDEFTKETKE